MTLNSSTGPGMKKFTKITSIQVGKPLSFSKISGIFPCGQLSTFTNLEEMDHFKK